MANSCPECGAPLREEAGQVFCPACALRGAFDVESRADASVAATGSAAPSDAGAVRGAVPGEIANRKSQIANPRLRYFGDYELLEEIARGGMGVVYKARQVSLNRSVAVKMILSGEFASTEFVQRFHREAEAAANLDHPNIVAIHEVGEHEGQHYFSMDYVAGKNLAEHISDSRFAISDYQRTARYLKTLAEAIHYAHQRGILHRDLKPSNVLIDGNDRPRVTDFGLAKRLTSPSDLAPRASDLTLTGQVLGSPNYMPPEQAEGKHRELTTASDIYSLGAILYHLLTGRPPFVGETLTSTLHQLLHTEPASPSLLRPDVPRDLETICLKCLSKEPQRRYATARELAEEMGRFLRDEPILARPAGRVEKSWRWCRRNPKLASLATVSVLLLLAVAIGSPIAAFRINRERRQAQRNLVRQYVASGNRLVEDGDLFGALPWFAQALKTEAHDPSRAAIHRIRLASTIAQCPKLTQMWFHQDLVRVTRFSPDGRWVLSTSEDLTARVWDAVTGEPVSPTMELLPGNNYYASFSPDGQRIVTVTGMRVGVWDVKTGKLLFPFLGHGTMGSANFSPDGRRIVTASRSEGIQFWDSATGQLAARSIKRKEGFGWAEFSPDGSRIFTADRVWDVATGEPVTPPLPRRGAGHGTELDEPKLPPGSAFSPDGRRLVIASGEGLARVFDAETGKELIQVHHRGVLRQAVFSPNGRWLVTGSDDTTARVWDAASGAPVTGPLPHAGPVIDTSFSRDGRSVVTASTDGTARVWDAATGRAVTPALRHAAPVGSASISPNGRQILTGSDDRAVRVWDRQGVGRALLTIKHPAVVQTAAFSPDSRMVVTVSVDGTAHAWDVPTGNILTAVETNLAGIRCAQFNPAGRWLATGASNGVARVWDAATGVPVGPPLIHTGLVNFLEFSPDGKWIVTAGSDSSARVWESATGKLVREFRHNESVNYASFTPDGKRLLTISLSVPVLFYNDTGEHWSFAVAEREAITASCGQAQLWNLETGQPLSQPRKLGASVSHTAVSPDRRVLFPVCSARALTENEVWATDLMTGRHFKRPLQHDKGVTHSSFSPDGRWVVTASWDHTARVWDAATGQPITPRLTHARSVRCAEFSPDSRLVVTASDDLTARVWDAATGDAVTPPLKHRAPVHRAFFSPDGRWLLTSSVDGMVHVWQLAGSGRSVEDEVLRTQLLAGRQIDETGTILPVTPALLQSAWLKLHGQGFLEWGSSSGPSLASSSSRGEIEDENIGPAVDLKPSVHTLGERLGEQVDASFGELRRSSTASSNQWARLIEEYSKVIALEPNVPLYYLNRGYAYEQIGQLQQAIKDFRGFLWTRGIVPKYVDAEYYLAIGRCYLRLGETEKAEINFKTAIESAPNDANGCNALAWALVAGPANSTSAAKALPLSLRAVALSKNSYAALNTLGVVYYRLGQLTNAVATLEAAVKADKQGGSAHDFFFLAMSHHRLGNAAKADDYFDKAMKWWKGQPTVHGNEEEELKTFRTEAEAVLGKSNVK